MGHTHLEDGGACGKALGNLGGEGQVLESGVIVIQVEQVDENCGTAGSSQGWPPACGGQEGGLKINASSHFQPFPPKGLLTPCADSHAGWGCLLQALTCPCYCLPCSP